MNEQIPDFINNLGNREDAELATSQKWFIDNGTKQIPDFISNPINKQSDVELNSVQPNYKDIEVRQNLWINFDNSFSQDKEQVKQYVDNLSKEDYKTRTDLKNEWYSLDARKAIFDNRDDLYDISAKGEKKYWTWNKNSFMQYLLDQEQSTLDFQNEVIHPWSVTTQERLNEISQQLMEPTYEDIKQALSAKEGKTWFLANIQNTVAKPLAWNLRQAFVAWWLVTNLMSKWVNLIDNLWNMWTQLKWELLNAIAWDKKWYNKYIVDPSQSVSLRWSQIQAVNDALWIWFTTAFPLATYIMTLVWGESDKVQNIMDQWYKWIKRVTKQVTDLVWEETLWLENLTPEEKELWNENIAMSVMILFGEALWWSWKKIGNTQTMKNFNAAVDVARKTSNLAKRTAENEIATSVKWAMKDLPEGSQLTTEWWTPLFTNTASWIKPTAQGSLYLLTKLGWAKINWFLKWLDWMYRTWNKKLVTRNPNAPTWEIPVTPWVRPEWPEPKLEEQSTWLKEVRNELKPEEIKTEWIKTTTPNTQVKPTIEAPKEETSTIWTFLKKIKDDISEISKTWSKKEIMDKLQTSKELQSEYINTIDPYLKANWWKNPNWVIEQPLRDFIETVKEQLEFMRNSEKDYMINSMKTKVNIPKMDQVLNKANQKQYKELIKVLSQEVDQPEQLLKYLLNLPKETTKTLDRIIPDYSKNLQLIKDTLDLTKAITSTDLLWKFLNYKSTIWTKDRNFLRKYLYKKLAETYNEQWVKRKMRDIETMLNTMSEEELVQLDKDIDAWNLRKFDESVDWRSQWYMKETFGEKWNRSLEQIMNSKRPWTNKTIREYLKEKWVKITAVDNNTQYRQLTHEMMWHESLAAYSENLDRLILKRFENPYFWFVFHEFGHRLFNQLGTNQMLDMLDYISKRDWISQEAAFERRAEYFRNYMQYNNIDWKRYILKELGEAFDPKLLQVMEKTKQEVFDLFNISWKDLEINQIMSDVKHDTKTWKEITSRKPQPLLNKRLGENLDERANWLKKIDPEVDSIVSDSTKWYTSIYDQWNIYIKMKNGDLETWNQFKNKLSEEQLSEVDTYEEQVLDDLIWDIFGVETEEWFKGEGKFNYDTLENQTPIRELLKDSFNVTKEDLWLDFMQTVTLLDELKKFDPDIVWLEEKNWKLMVKYIVEWYSERRELPDRPWQLEVKEAPARDYLSKEEIESLPKDFQDMVTKDEWLYQGWQWWLQYSEWKNLKLGNWYYFGNYKQAKEFGPALIELEKNDWKLKEYKDTQEYQVEASMNGWKEEFNKKLKKEWYDWIKAYNRSFKTDEYNFFENPFKKNLVTNKK